MADPELSSVRVDDLEICFRRTGDGSPLLLLHGILSDSRAWRPQFDGLADGLSLIAWDAPGAGRSADPPEEFGPGGYVDSLVGLMDELGLQDAHVLGLSWGGVLAQELYRHHPSRVRSLLLADTYAGWRGSLPAEECEARLESCLRESELPAEEFVPRWLPGLLSESAPDKLREEVTEVMSDFHPEGYRQMAHAVAEIDTRDLLPRIRVPTVLIWGERDRRSPLDVAEQLHSGIPGSRLVVIPQVGHESNLEHPGRFNAAVREFCREVDLRAAAGG
jgi:pimeloyl-ACP methyl ester carboxylesterase